MSFEADASLVQQYTTMVRAKAQQKESRLQMAFMAGNHFGKNAVAVEQIGPVEAIEPANRHADTQYISTPHDKRWIAPRPFIWADLIDDEDKVRQLADFESPYSTNGSSAIKRAKDRRAIAALYSVAKTGEDGTTNSGTPVVMTAAALTVARILEAKRRLDEAEVDEDDPRYFVLPGRQVEKLLNQTEIKSADFNTVRALAMGELDSFAGFKFIRSQLLPLSGSNDRCFAWAKSGMHFGVWRDIETFIDRMPAKNNSWQVMVKGNFNATRTEEVKVIEVISTP